MEHRFIRSQLRIPIWLELSRSNKAQAWSTALYSQPVAHSNLIGTFSQQQGASVVYCPLFAASCAFQSDWNFLAATRRKCCIFQNFFTMKPLLSIRSQLRISTFIPYFLTCTVQLFHNSEHSSKYSQIVIQVVFKYIENANFTFHALLIIIVII